MAKYGDVTLTFDQGAVNAVIGGYAREAAQKASEAFIKKAQRGILALGRVQTGDMLNGWEKREEGPPLAPIVTVHATVPYTIYQERGTRGSQARPGRFLRFSVGGRMVFTKKTGPIAAGNFMRDAIEGIRLSDFGAY